MPRLVPWLIAAALLGACSPPPPGDGGAPVAAPSAPDSQSPREPYQGMGPRVAVVLPARAAKPAFDIAREREALEELGEQAIRAGVISEFRLALPDRVATIVDVAQLLVDEGYDVVCALGPGAARAVGTIVGRSAGTKLCAAPAGPFPGPLEALYFDFRIEELAYLAGVAAAGVRPRLDASRPEPAILVSEGLDGQRLGEAFLQGYSLVAEPPNLRVRTVATADAALSTGTNLLEADVGVVLSLAGRAEFGVIEGAHLFDGQLIGGISPGSLGDEGGALSRLSDQDWNLMVVRQNLYVAIRDMLDEYQAGWTGGNRSIGFANGAFDVEGGDSPLWPLISTQVLSLRDALVAGEIALAGQ